MNELELAGGILAAWLAAGFVVAVVFGRIARGLDKRTGMVVKSRTWQRTESDTD